MDRKESGAVLGESHHTFGQRNDLRCGGEGPCTHACSVLAVREQDKVSGFKVVVVVVVEVVVVESN